MQIILVKDGLPVDFAVPDGVELGVFIEVTGEATLARLRAVDHDAVAARRIPAGPEQDPARDPAGRCRSGVGRADHGRRRPEDAEVTLNVLQRGPEGVLLTPTQVGQATQLVSICSDTVEDLQLEEIEIVATHLGPGERVRRYLLALRP